MSDFADNSVVPTMLRTKVPVSVVSVPQKIIGSEAPSAPTNTVAASATGRVQGKQLCLLESSRHELVKYCQSVQVAPAMQTHPHAHTQRGCRETKDGKLSATDPCSFYWKLICGVLLLADEHIAWTCTVGDEMSSSAAGSTYIAYNDSRVLCSCSAVFDPFSRAQVCDAAGTETHIAVATSGH